MLLDHVRVLAARPFEYSTDFYVSSSHVCSFQHGSLTRSNAPLDFPALFYPSLNRGASSWFKDLTLFRSCSVVCIRRVTWRERGGNSRENFSLRAIISRRSFQIFIFGLLSLDGELIYGMPDAFIQLTD